jgi:alanyl aminopeptidase
MRHCLRTLVLLLPVASASAYEPPKLRLPGDVRPVSYSAELQLTPGQDPFSGRIRIDVEIRTLTPVIWLHANELELTSARLGSMPARVERTAGDFVGIVPERPALPGRSTLDVEYRGNLSRTLTDGIFHQRFNNDWYLFTKFEPVTARRAFPCFDEPSFKTPWQITLRIPSGLQAVSNTPVLKETPGSDGTTQVQFARTKPLPTYLVALAVGPFEFVDAGPLGQKRFPGRIVVPRGRSAEAAYAASVTPEAIRRLESYFGISYPYEKLDQIVVPITTSWGAMENAGMIAYGQWLLAKPEEDTPGRQRGRLGTMLHEMAHQWFGNYVTMAWWDDIWLNEGFASWLQFRILRDWHPEWRSRSALAASAGQAMLTDALASARKVRQPIETPGDIGIAFDGITYMKGSALLAMFENAIGPDKFQKGVQSYLRRHAWSNATTADLTTELGKAAGQDVTGAFSTFLDQTGVPLVRAEARCSGTEAKLALSQERFRPIGSTAGAGATWKIPVCYRWSDGREEHRECVMLTSLQAEFSISRARGCPEWVTVDDNGAGYYRTAYESATFEKLLNKGAEHLQSHEQVKLLADAQALSAGGVIDPAVALRLAQRFGAGSDQQTVTAAARIVGSLGRLVPDDLESEYDGFVRDAFGPRARELGWRPKQGEPEETNLVRATLVPVVAIRGRDKELAGEARSLAERWLADHRALGRDLTSVVLMSAARYGDKALYDRYLKALKTEPQQSDRLTLAGALGAFPDPALMKSSLALLIPGEPGLDPRELTGVLTTQWPETRGLVWSFIKENFDQLNTRLPGARAIPFGAALPSRMTGFCDETVAAEMESFFGARLAKLNGGPRNLATALESVRLCAAQKKALDAGLRRFFSRGPTAGRRAGMPYH